MTHCFAESTEARHARIVRNHVELHGPWLGWRLAGRDLVAPDGQRLSRWNSERPDLRRAARPRTAFGTVPRSRS